MWVGLDCGWRYKRSVFGWMCEREAQSIIWGGPLGLVSSLDVFPGLLPGLVWNGPLGLRRGEILRCSLWVEVIPDIQRLKAPRERGTFCPDGRDGIVGPRMAYGRG